ncbi:MAG: hypothetical protein ACREQB_02670 [Candidatus Binataceae bacterium]
MTADQFATVRFALSAVLAAGVASGCSSLGMGETRPEPTAVQSVEYYPFQVKGYQNTYPKRSIVVLMPVDASERKDGAAAGAPAGKVAVGVTTGQSGEVVQRIFTDPLPAVVQKAIGRSAQEAGMVAYALAQTEYDKVRSDQHEDYILATRIKRAWVDKHRAADNRFGEIWKAVADVTLEVKIYKPPFTLPFWEGTSSSTYNDPELGTFALGPQDETGIYEDPGQVLSVALTRAVAGIFDRDDLRTLITEDVIKTR